MAPMQKNKFGNVAIFVLFKFENQLYVVVINSLSQNQTAIIIYLSCNHSQVFQKCQQCQLCVLRENWIDTVYF